MGDAFLVQNIKRGRPLGSSSNKPAISAQEAYEDGWRGTTVWLLINGNPYELAFDPTDRYGTGEFGWANYTSNFFGANNTTIPYTTFGSPASISSSFDADNTTSITNTTISTGGMRIGRDQAHSGGNSLGTVRVALPFFKASRYFCTNATSGGTDSADFGTSWQTGQPFNQIVTNTPYQSNGSGYWMVLWSGRTAANGGSWSNDFLIMDDGQANQGFGGNVNTNFTVTSVVRRYSSQTTNTPYAIWGTTDAFNEYAYYRVWNIWLH